MTNSAAAAAAAVWAVGSDFFDTGYAFFVSWYLQFYKRHSGRTHKSRIAQQSLQYQGIVPE